MTSVSAWKPRMMPHDAGWAKELEERLRQTTQQTGESQVTTPLRTMSHSLRY